MGFFITIAFLETPTAAVYDELDKRMIKGFSSRTTMPYTLLKLPPGIYHHKERPDLEVLHKTVLDRPDDEDGRCLFDWILAVWVSEVGESVSLTRGGESRALERLSLLKKMG
jgi:hypothetical protein